MITARAAAKEITSKREIQRNAIATKNTRRSSTGRRLYNVRTTPNDKYKTKASVTPDETFRNGSAMKSHAKEDLLAPWWHLNNVCS